MASTTQAEANAEFGVIFCNQFNSPWNNIAQTPGSPLANLYISLHNANPGQAGSQTTNETAYSNYARLAVPRNTSNWNVQSFASTYTPVIVQNSFPLTWPACGVTGDTLTHWGIGTAASGAGNLLFYGPLVPNSSGNPQQDIAVWSAPGGAGTVNQFTIGPPFQIGSYTVNSQVMIYPTPYSLYSMTGTWASAGLTEGIPYYVGTNSGGIVTLSTTLSNANPVLNPVGTSGICTIFQLAPITVSLGFAPSLPANNGFTLSRY